MTPGQVRVFLIRPGAIPEDPALGCLTNEEKARADRFHFRDDALDWISCRAQLRTILGGNLGLLPLEVPLVISDTGKPQLSPPHDWVHFNLSHCSGLALVALCQDGPVGVDIEPLSRADGLLECVSSFCHPLEIRSLPESIPARAARLLEIWTAKEAVLKALGVGLSQAPETVRIVFEAPSGTAICDPPLAGIEDQRIHPIIHSELAAYSAAVSAPRSAVKIEIR